MDINIKFSKKARSPNMDKAIELAKDHNYEEKGDIITVTFNEFSKEFDKLWRIISSWISTEIFIDGEEIENSTINNIIYCYHKATCNGNCKHIRLEDWYSIDRLYTDIEDAKRGTYSPERLKLQLE